MKTIKLERPSWTHFFMHMAWTVKSRSPDPNTKHGAVIVDDDNHIISMGYNGYPRGFPDHSMPNTSPAKYNYIVHCELNSLLNATGCVKGCTLYVTGQPCNECLKHIIQTGIARVIYMDRMSHMLEVDNDYWSIQSKLLSCARNFQMVPVKDYDPAKYTKRWL